jgi:type II secretory pathway pseudopilin PulG
MKLSKHKLKGFTLIETIVYVVLIGSVIGSFITFVLLATQIKSKMHIMEEVMENERTMEEIINYFIRNSERVVVPGKSASSTTLTLQKKSNTKTLTFRASGTTVYLFDQATTTPLTTSEVAISNLLFTNLSAAGTKDVIRVTGKISSAINSSQEYKYEDTFSFNISIPYFKP